jgi:hypothetical protein
MAGLCACHDDDNRVSLVGGTSITGTPISGLGLDKTPAMGEKPGSRGPSPPASSPPAASPPPPTDAGSPPQITGTPVGVASVGTAYEFQPTASDMDDDPLTFSITGKPSWASFDSSTGRLWGTPQTGDAGLRSAISISVSDGSSSSTLAFSLSVTAIHEAHYGHYFATRALDTPDDVAMLCDQPGVSGVVWRRTWKEVEPSAGNYNFGSFDDVLAAIAGSHNPQCQLWLFIEFKSFSTSAIKNPCPTYLQARSALNAHGADASTCFMWEPAVVQAYVAMMKAAAAKYGNNPRVEGFIFQESSLGFTGAYSQDVADGGTYTPEAWRDALIEMIGQCGAAFQHSRCLAFMNFIRGGRKYLYDVSSALAAIPDDRGCMSGPDVLPNNPSLYQDTNSAYQVLVRHRGCRSNSVQNDSFEVPGCGLDCIFHFAVGGTYGWFDASAPYSSGLCVNSYLFWNHRTQVSNTGLDWHDALPVIAAYPYGRGWTDHCDGGGGPL